MNCNRLLRCCERRNSDTHPQPHIWPIGQTCSTAHTSICHQLGNILCCESCMEQEEWTGPRSHADNSVASIMARQQPLWCSKRPVQCTRDCIWKAGGASTYLQLVNMVKIQFTNSTDLLSQIQQFQDNYNRITSNGHSRLSEDLATIMFCSSLPTSYELTTQQYLDNITVIANYSGSKNRPNVEPFCNV